MMKRRFVVVTEKSQFGVIADHHGQGLFGLSFYNDAPDVFQRPVVIAFAPGAWLCFMELAEGEDWPELDLNEVMQFGEG